METGIFIGLMLFFAAMIVGLPFAWVLILSSVVALVLTDNSLVFTAGAYYSSLNNYIIAAIAFYIYAGLLMSEAGVGEQIVSFSYQLVGRLKGGLIDVCIVASLFLGALTGSTMPVMSALIPLMVPELEKYGYQRKYTTSVICSSSFLGYLIPPSVPVLLYCLVSGASVAAVFLSTVIPGLLLALGYMILNTIVSRRYMFPSKEAPVLPSTFVSSVKAAGKSFWLALPALGCPVIILGGIYGGIFTPGEAGAVAVIYTVLIGLFVYRKLKLKRLWPLTVDVISIIGMTLVLLGFAAVFTRLMVREGVAQDLATLVMGIFHTKVLVLLVINLFLIVLGMFISAIATVLIIIPLLLPMVDPMGINLVHLGAIVVINVGIANVSPPFAPNIFLAAKLTNIPFEELLPSMLLYLFMACLPVLLITTYIPAVSCWLPTLAMGSKIVGPW